MPTTEVISCALVSGSKPGDPDNEAAKVLKEVGDTLSNQNGLQQAQFGMQIEKENMLQMFMDWDSIASHHAFEKTGAYKPFLQRFMTIVDGEPTICHVDFKPDGALPRALSAPVTEVATFYFAGEAPKDYLEKATRFLANNEGEKVDGYLGGAVGTTYEEIEREGVKGKGAVLVIGWSSVEAHMKFRETSTFKDNIQLLRQGAQKISMNHVPFMTFIKD
ncbi:Hypothetical predicted protein [Lecanosticta acicola]|uniref:ABM domain-containing protein n=1 Tax=Lecanosticta acicola TaxID=111012 RepID=A0AAI9EAE3_9PEZI|nr:Hypothetical predicted protein [Lecanosticta acicola]